MSPPGNFGLQELGAHQGHEVKGAGESAAGSWSVVAVTPLWNGRDSRRPVAFGKRPRGGDWRANNGAGLRIHLRQRELPGFSKCPKRRLSTIEMATVTG